MYPSAPRKVREDKFPDTIPYSLLLELVVTDPEVITELWAKPEGRERDEYALGALRLGILALRQARGQIDAAAPAVPHEDERPLDVPPTLSDARSCAGQDAFEESEEGGIDAEPVAEDLEETVATGYESAAVSACYWLRRRRRRSRLSR
jgi:hypothetical protein